MIRALEVVYFAFELHEIMTFHKIPGVFDTLTGGSKGRALVGRRCFVKF